MVLVVESIVEGIEERIVEDQFGEVIGVEISF